MAAGTRVGGGGGGSRRGLDKKSSTQNHGARNKSNAGAGVATAKNAKKLKKDDATNIEEEKAAIHDEVTKKTRTLEQLIDAVSDEEEGEDDDEEEEEEDDAAGEESDDDDDDDETRAGALRKMIRDGKFDQLLLKTKTSNADDEAGEEEEDDEEHDNDEDEEDEEVNDDDDEDDDDDDDEEEEEEISPENYEMAIGDDEDDDEDSSSSDEDTGNENGLAQQKRQHDNSNNSNNINHPASSVRILALQTSSLAADRHLPWPESFAVTAVTPLPFTLDATTTSSSKKGVAGELLGEYEEGMDTGGGGVDVHDDLAREVAFYDTALECTTMAREQCNKFGIPFARPEDFFAEMVKSDDHMAKIKDRLIYETKKMDAVQRRKSNKEHTLMAKERNAHRLAEKAKAKKAHMSAVDDWKKDAERNRGRHVGDSHEDEGHLRGIMSGGGGGGPNKRRESANKRYGFGGKRGRFKQNDKATLNDMSGFNPRGGFAGGGRKSPGGAGGKKRPNNSSGKKRPGKRARDSARSR